MPRYVVKDRPCFLGKGKLARLYLVGEVVDIDGPAPKGCVALEEGQSAADVLPPPPDEDPEPETLSAMQRRGRRSKTLGETG